MAGRQKKTARGEGAATSYIAPPVQRAVRLLRHIADGDPVTSMSETAKTLKINRTTLLRLLYTLESEGFVERRSDEGGYQVGPSLVALLRPHRVLAGPHPGVGSDRCQARGKSRDVGAPGRARGDRCPLSAAPHPERAAGEQHTASAAAFRLTPPRWAGSFWRT